MGQYKSQYTGPQIDAGINAALNPDLVPTDDSDALITSDAVAKVQQGFAPIETDATASKAYAIGDLLVWGGILYKAKTAIAVNDSFTVGTNIEATTIADKLNNIDTEITANTDTTLTGVLIGNGSKVGTKSLDTSLLTNDADHVPVSSVVKSALDNVNSNIGIVENGDTASQNISAEQYVIWKGTLYTADSAIASGATLASTGGNKNLTAVSNGGLNDLPHYCNTASSLISTRIPFSGSYEYTCPNTGFYSIVVTSNTTTAHDIGIALNSQNISTLYTTYRYQSSRAFAPLRKGAKITVDGASDDIIDIYFLE